MGGGVGHREQGPTRGQRTGNVKAGVGDADVYLFFAHATPCHITGCGRAFAGSIARARATTALWPLLTFRDGRGWAGAVVTIWTPPCLWGSVGSDRPCTPGAKCPYASSRGYLEPVSSATCERRDVTQATQGMSTTLPTTPIPKATKAM